MLPAKAGRAPGTAVVTARALSAGRRTALIAAALAFAVTGCGDSDDENEGSGGGDPGTTELTITLDPDGPGGEPARTEIATCGPTGGTACARLQSTDFAPLDAGTPCTQIYGGPDQAIVEGTVDGESVTATLTRADGCEIERFDRLLPLLRELFPGYEPGEALKP